VPMLVLSQLRPRARGRGKGGPSPRSLRRNLRESGQHRAGRPTWWRFIFREEVYKRDREDLRGIAELFGLPSSAMVRSGKIDLVFLHHLTKFENRGGRTLGEMDG